MEATDAVEYEPGIYRAKVKDIVEQESPFLDDNTGEKKWQYVWTFELLEDGYEGQTLRGWSSTAFGPRAKARAWAEHLLGRKIVAGEKVSTDDLIGKECDLMLTLKETDRGSFANVDSVNPVRKKKAKAESKEAPEVPAEDLERAPF